ncbi:hypothetical protein V6N13_008130 [Hibiscus sabdariffa]
METPEGPVCESNAIARYGEMTECLCQRFPSLHCILECALQSD